MPIADLLFSFTKKQNTIYSVFLDSWKNIRDLREISKNLERMYECLSYEQSRQIDSKCIDYFISNELSFSILKLAELSYKSEVNTFFIKLISILSKAHLEKLNYIFINAFCSHNKDYLGIALIYAERIVVYEMYLNELFVDFITKYVFDDDIFGEYSRASLIYLFSHKDIYVSLDRIGFIYTFIDTLNSLYKDINKNITFYTVLIEFLCLYVNKDKIGNKCERIQESIIKSSTQGIVNNGTQCEFVQLKFSSYNSKELSHETSSNIVSLNDNLFCLMTSFEENENHNDYSSKVYNHSNLSRTNLGPRNDLIINKDRILENLDISNRHENQLKIYTKILKANVLDIILKNIIEEFIANFNDDDDSISFLKYLINNHSNFFGRYFFNDKKTEWVPFEVYRKIFDNIREHKPTEFKIEEIKNKEKINILNKILEMKINDEDIYIFLFMVSRSTFFNNFDEIYEIMKEHKTFFGSIYRIFMQ